MARSYSKMSKRRSNVIHKLMRQGVMVDEAEREIDVPYDAGGDVMRQVMRLRRECRFNVQYYIS